MNYFICFFTLITFFSHTCANNNSGLELIFFSKNGEIVYTLITDDIQCFDWEHQSVNVSDKAKAILLNNLDLLKGKMKVVLEGKTLYEADIISESIDYEFGTPKLVFQDKGLFFVYENWFLIRYIKNKYELKDGGEPYFEQLINKDLFNFLNQNNKLGCKNWTKVADLEAECCDLDLDPVPDAEKVFRKN